MHSRVVRLENDCDMFSIFASLFRYIRPIQCTIALHVSYKLWVSYTFEYSLTYIVCTLQYVEEYTFLRCRLSNRMMRFLIEITKKKTFENIRFSSSKWHWLDEDEEIDHAHSVALYFSLSIVGPGVCM